MRRIRERFRQVVARLGEPILYPLKSLGNGLQSPVGVAPIVVTCPLGSPPCGSGDSREGAFEPLDGVRRTAIPGIIVAGSLLDEVYRLDGRTLSGDVVVLSSVVPQVYRRKLVVSPHQANSGVS